MVRADPIFLENTVRIQNKWSMKLLLDVSEKVLEKGMESDIVDDLSNDVVHDVFTYLFYI